MFKKIGGALANAAKQQVQHALQAQQQQQQPQQQYQPPQQQYQPPQQQQWQPPQQQWAPQPPPQVTPPTPQPPQGFPNPGEIWVFTDPSFRGQWSRFTVGDAPNLAALGINDNLSSIRCGPNTYVDLFEDASFAGNKFTVMGDMPTLGNFDNRASSLRVYTQDPLPTGAPPPGEAWLYSELQFGGTILRAVGDCPDLNVQRANDSIRSLRVGAATMVELFDGQNYTGRSKAWNADDPSLVDDGFDRVASSLKVRSVSAATPALPQMPPVPRGEVWLYAAPNFSGQSFRSIISCPDMKLMGCDDMISSVRCGPGTAIEFAMDVNMGGQRQLFQGDAPDIGPFARRASSFTITLDGQPQGSAQPQAAPPGPPMGSGRRKALLIGINYVAEPRAALKGCWNDVENMRNYLISIGYPQNNIRVMRDKPGEESPTKANIQAGVKWLMDGAQPGDSLFMHYSGHGTQVAAASGKEVDNQNEALCPCDFRTAGLVEDDELNAVMVTPMKEGVRLTCVFDCCHSGTALDLPYTEIANRDVPAPRAVREAQLDAKARALAGLKSAFLQGLAQYKQQQGGRAAGGGGFNFNSLLQIGANVVKQQLLNPQQLTPDQRREAHRTNDGTSLAGQVVLYSGCKDDQCSADACFGGQPAGALTNALLTTIQQRQGNLSWIELLYAARKLCGTGSIAQTPQISFNNPKFNLDSKLTW